MSCNKLKLQRRKKNSKMHSFKLGDNEIIGWISQGQRDRNKRPAVPGTTQHWPLPHILSVHSNTHKFTGLNSSLIQTWAICTSTITSPIILICWFEKHLISLSMSCTHFCRFKHLVFLTLFVMLSKQNFESGVNLIWSLMDRRHAKH